MKIYARQVAPEYQDPFYLLEDYNGDENVIIYGNKEYKGLNGDFIKDVENKIDDILMMYENDYYKSFYKNFSEACNDILYSGANHKPYNTKQVHNIKEFCKNYDYRQERENNVFILELLTGKKWDYQSIAGCVQREWNYIYFSEDIDKNTINYLECIYFNMGTEWVIDDQGEFDDENDDPANIYGYSYYSIEYDTDKIKQEIKENFCNIDDDVILYEFTGFSRVAGYSIV